MGVYYSIAMISDEALDVYIKLTSISWKKTGSEGHQVSKAILLEHLTKYFPDVSTRDFPISLCKNNRAEIETKDNQFEGYLYDYTGAENIQEFRECSVSAPIMHLHNGNELDFLLNKVKGKIVLCRSNVRNHRGLQIERAQKNGALALLVYSDFDDQIVYGAGALPWKGCISIPAVGICKKDALKLMKQPVGNVNLKYKIDYESSRGTNIIVRNNTDENSERIILGAHFDGWSYSAQDNSVSIYILLSLIDYLQERNIPFEAVFFDAEELGMLGAQDYCSHIDSSKVKAYYNLDMAVKIHYRIPTLVFFSKEFRKLSFLYSMIRKGLIPAPLSMMYSRKSTLYPSDLHFFFKAGIPCMSLFNFNSYYHTELDTQDKLSSVQIEKTEFLSKFLLDYILNAM
jgi:hypothetical protein